MLTARKPGEAAMLLDEIIKRAQAGETLPKGINLERLLLTAANTHFQIKSYARAAELGEAVEKQPSVGPDALAEARMIRGLSLALQEKFVEAMPVFRSAEESRTYRDKAMLYGAMSASQAGQIPVAIQAYNRLLATSPRNRDWADASLALIDLYLRAESPNSEDLSFDNITEARNRLSLLRRDLALVDNLAGLNILVLQLGDFLMKGGDNSGALAAFRSITSRDALIAEQKKRIAGIERTLKRLDALTNPSATDTDSIRRFGARLEQAKSSLEQVEKFVGYDASLRYRLAYTFQERGGAWEAALLYEDLLANHPDSEERENAFFGLIRAYADANRFDKVNESADRFIRHFPDSKFGPQALYLAAVAAGQRKDTESQLKFLEVATSRYPNSELNDSLRLMRANALFTIARYQEAKEIVTGYLRDFPKGQFVESARYLAAMADLAEGNASASEAQIIAYLKDYPEGGFIADAQYRLAATAYAKEQFAECAKLCEKWLAQFPPDHEQRGEIHSTHGDALAALSRPEDAIIAYHSALALNLSDEQLGYVLDELTRLYQSRKEYDAAVAMWEQFAANNPDHPFVINAAYWISRIRNREGRSAEALTLVSDITRRYVNDPSRGDVERLLVEIASTLARPVRARRGEPKPEPIPDELLFTRARQLILDQNTRANPTAQARTLFVQSEIASLRENYALRDEILSKIASNHTPDQLPPGILGKVGDTLLAQDQPELAKKFYEQIINEHARSIFADYAYVGLGEIALIDGDANDALGRFNAAIDVAGARFKLKEATLGRGRAYMLLGRMDQAQEVFEQAAGNRAWRGETTAESLYNLGEIALRRGTSEDLAKAQAHFQRIYLSYKRFNPWVARAYVRSAETFEKLGMITEAVTTVNRMFTEERLRPYRSEWSQAQEIHRRLSPLVPSTPAPAEATPATTRT